MTDNPEPEVAGDTRRLLSELERAIDHSSTLRALVGHREQLYHLETLTGPSRKTQSLRQEISRMEQRLRSDA